MLQDASNSHSKQRSKESNSNSPGISSEMLKNGLAYQCLLKNELLGAEIEDINEFKQIEERKALTPLLNRNVFRVIIDLMFFLVFY